MSVKFLGNKPPFSLPIFLNENNITKTFHITFQGKESFTTYQVANFKVIDNDQIYHHNQEGLSYLLCFKYSLLMMKCICILWWCFDSNIFYNIVFYVCFAMFLGVVFLSQTSFIFVIEGGDEAVYKGWYNCSEAALWKEITGARAGKEIIDGKILFFNPLRFFFFSKLYFCNSRKRLNIFVLTFQTCHLLLMRVPRS